MAIQPPVVDDHVGGAHVRVQVWRSLTSIAHPRTFDTGPMRAISCKSTRVFGSTARGPQKPKRLDGARYRAAQELERGASTRASGRRTRATAEAEDGGVIWVGLVRASTTRCTRASGTKPRRSTRRPRTDSRVLRVSEVAEERRCQRLGAARARRQARGDVTGRRCRLISTELLPYSFHSPLWGCCGRSRSTSGGSRRAAIKCVTELRDQVPSIGRQRHLSESCALGRHA